MLPTHHHFSRSTGCRSQHTAQKPLKHFNIAPQPQHCPRQVPWGLTRRSRQSAADAAAAAAADGTSQSNPTPAAAAQPAPPPVAGLKQPQQPQQQHVQQHALSEPPALAQQQQQDGLLGPVSPVADDSDVLPLEVDPWVEKELMDSNGFRSSRRTKLVCTIGPSSSTFEVLSLLADNGMNIARLNMTHGTHAWHSQVVQHIRRLNREKGYCIAIMADTEGSEIHTGELQEAIKVEVGTRVYFTIRQNAPQDMGGVPVVKVNYDSLGEDVEVGDHIVVDGGMCELVVVSKAGPDVLAESIEQGLLLSKANLTFRRDGELVRGRAAMLPVITSKDWQDIDWAINARVDFIAVSFVRTADVITNLRSYIQTRMAATQQQDDDPGHTHQIELIAKLEAYDCLQHLDAIVQAADGIMVARGDLGAQIPVEEVPSVQKYAVMRARQLGKPAIVAHQLLHSMIEHPVPTRAEVADVADVVRQRADALMLSGESAMGAYPDKALGVLRGVALRMEEWLRQEKFGGVVLPQIGTTPDGRVSEEVCASAALMANKLEAAAIFVFTRRGYMAHFLSRCRPDCPVLAFTDDQAVRRRLNLRWGVMPFWMPFCVDPEENVRRTFALMSQRGFVRAGDLVVVVTDLRPAEGDIIRSVQVRRVQ